MELHIRIMYGCYIHLRYTQYALCDSIVVAVVAFSSLEIIWGECSTIHFLNALFFKSGD